MKKRTKKEKVVASDRTYLKQGRLEELHKALVSGKTVSWFCFNNKQQRVDYRISQIKPCVFKVEKATGNFVQVHESIDGAFKMVQVLLEMSPTAPIIEG